MDGEFHLWSAAVGVDFEFFDFSVFGNDFGGGGFDANGLEEEVVVVAEGGGEGDAAGFDKFFAEHFFGDVGDEVGADLDGAIDGSGLAAGFVGSADEVAGDGAALDGDAGLGGDDAAEFVGGDFEDGVVVGGEPAADVVDAQGDEDAAIRGGCDFWSEGAVVGAGERVFGDGFGAFVPAAEALSEAVFINGYLCEGTRREGDEDGKDE